MYDISSGVVWRPGAASLYKWLPAGAEYGPASSWWGVARFGAGEHKTLYLAETPAGAMAEFFRRFPEFLDSQDDLNITLHRVDVAVDCDCVDVRTAEGANAVGMVYSRLLSSEPDENERYAECRELAKDVIAADHCGLAYPSAAATWPTWNLVLFGDAAAWLAVSHEEVPTPSLGAGDVNVLPHLMRRG